MNTLEHGITRGSDAFVSLILLWAFSAETFAKLATSQALVAPMLLLFIAPETVLYRDFASWRAEGVSSIAARLTALRRFAWGKAFLALALSGVLAQFATESRLDRFWALVWAFALVLTPQISGPDREFLRLDLHFKTLNALTIYQKLSILMGTCIVALSFPGRIDLLAGVAVFSAASTALFASSQVKNLLRAEGASESAIKGESGPSPFHVLRHSLTSFSGWRHLIGIVLGWVQTMDVFFLSILRFPGRGVGLYAATLKIGSFSTLLPFALSNVFSIWLGRRIGGLELAREKKELKRFTLLLSGIVITQSVVLYLVAPLLFRLLSHGRWDFQDLQRMHLWLAWILGGSAILSTTFIISSWLPVRGRISRLFWEVYLPWGLASLGIYFCAIHFGLGGDSFLGAAMANVFVSGVYLGLLLFHLWKMA